MTEWLSIRHLLPLGKPSGFAFGEIANGETTREGDKVDTDDFLTCLRNGQVAVVEL